MRELRIVTLLSRLEHAALLDPVSEALTTLTNRIIRPKAVRDILHGVPAGHPLHPVAVMVPIGCWTSSAILDVLPGTRRPSRLLIGAGLLGVIPAVASGFTDWSELHPEQKRVGLLHATANVIAATFYLASFTRRSPTATGNGRLLALAGLAAVSASGFIGGHLSYRQAAGANHTEDIPHLFPAGWQHLAHLDSLPDGELTTVNVAGQPLLTHRHGDTVTVLSNTCSHLSGPLSEGRIVGEGADACVECPWHASRFSLTTGDVVHGPATAPQPHFDTQIVDGTVEVRLPHAN